MTNNHVFIGPLKLPVTWDARYAEILRYNISSFRDEQNMRKLAWNPILRRMTQKVTFYETVCNKMLGVCTPIIGGPRLIFLSLLGFSWHLSCFVSFRNGVVGASYLPSKIVFDPKVKRIHPEPIKEAKWITVCGKKDKQCVDNCHDHPPRKKQT